MKKFNFNFKLKRQDGFTTIFELVGIAMVRALTGELIPARGSIRKITDIAFAGAATASVLSYTVPKVTDFVRVKSDEKKPVETGENATADSSVDYRETVTNDISQETNKSPESLKGKLVNIVSGALTEGIEKALVEKNVNFIKIDNDDPNKQMIFAVMKSEDVNKLKDEYDCDVVYVNEPNKWDDINE